VASKGSKPEQRGILCAAFVQLALLSTSVFFHLKQKLPVIAAVVHLCRQRHK
jgi:hypothetical protein